MFCGNSREQGTSSGAAGLCSSYLKPWMVHEGELIIENIHPPPSIGNCEVEAGAEFQSSMPFSVLRSSFWVPARLHLTCSLPAIKKKSPLEMKLPPLATNTTSTNWIFRPPSPNSSSSLLVEVIVCLVRLPAFSVCLFVVSTSPPGSVYVFCKKMYTLLHSVSILHSNLQFRALKNMDKNEEAMKETFSLLARQTDFRWAPCFSPTEALPSLSLSDLYLHIPHMHM